MRILLSRTDSIGDVMLTLPMAGIMKKLIPELSLHFLGSAYTKSIIACCEHIDEFITWDELASMNETDAINTIKAQNYDACIHVFPVKRIAQLLKKSKITLRIGASGRLYHYGTCNKIVRFSRRRSTLHESQLNLKLLQGLGLDVEFDLNDLPAFYGFTKIPEATKKVSSFIKKGKINLILHPKSKGSAVEWGLENFSALINSLPPKYHVFISGTSADGHIIGDALPFENNNVTSILGEFSLDEFTSFINACDGLIAASTGPLHIAAAEGKVAIGLFSNRRPIHPGRWQPVGILTSALVYDEDCSDCAKEKKCDCIKKISIERVIQTLDVAFKEGF